MITHRSERRLLGLLTTFLYASWLLPCITDVNHPPGVRFVRGAAALVTLGILWLEHARPWYGFYTFLLLWPNALIIQELLSRHAPLWQRMPPFWSGPLAAALALAYWWRLDGTTSSNGAGPAPVQPDSSPQRAEGERTSWAKWVGAFRIALWVLVLSWLLSMVCSLWRLQAWEALPLSWRLLLSQPQISPLAPFLSTASVLPSLLLGLLLLNGASDPAFDGPGEPIARPRQTASFQKIMGLIGLLLAVELVVQVCTGWTWSFDAYPPSGPFPNRNTTAPLLVLLGVVSFPLVFRFHGLKRFLLAAVLATVALCSCLTASRNGLFLLLSLPLLVLLLRSTWRRTILAGLLAAAVAATTLFAPLPESHGTLREFWQRLAEARQDLRDGSWEVLLSGRLDLFRSALAISRRYPLTGSGPDTFARETQPPSRLSMAEQHGEFSVKRCEDKDGRFLEVRLVKPPADGHARLELLHEVPLPVRPGKSFELSARGCVTPGATAALFYRDKTGAGWHRTAWPVAAKDWKKITGTATARAGIEAACVGVSFAPASTADCLRLGELSLLRDDFSEWRGPDQVPAEQLAATVRVPGVCVFAAHSMPLNLLAEIGPLGMAAWLAVWIVLPLLALMRWPRGNTAALALLLAGAANLFDTLWLENGATTFSVLLVVLACWQRRLDPEPPANIEHGATARGRGAAKADGAEVKR